MDGEPVPRAQPPAPATLNGTVDRDASGSNQEFCLTSGRRDSRPFQRIAEGDLGRRDHDIRGNAIVPPAIRRP